MSDQRKVLDTYHQSPTPEPLAERRSILSYNQQRQQFLDLHKFILHYFDISGIFIKPNGTISGSKYGVDDLILLITDTYKRAAGFFNQAREEHGFGRIVPVSKYDVGDAFSLVVATAKIQAEEELARELACQQENLEPLQRFTQIICGPQHNDTILMVLAHWIWLVKRSLDNNRSTVWQIMPVLSGKQGGGKSTIISKLLEPLEDFIIHASLDTITDERTHEALSQNLILWFDEMSGASRADMESLKRIVTSPVISFRRMRSTQVVNVPIKARGIGATNKSLTELFSDPTGMRRFYEIRCLDKFDRELVNDFDYKSLWRGVDENKPRGYIEPVITEVSEAQEELVIESDFEAFVHEYNLKPCSKETPDATKISQQDLFVLFDRFRESRRALPVSLVWFARNFNHYQRRTRVKQPDGRIKGFYFFENNPLLSNSKLQLIKGNSND